MACVAAAAGAAPAGAAARRAARGGARPGAAPRAAAASARRGPRGVAARAEAAKAGGEASDDGLEALLEELDLDIDLDELLEPPAIDGDLGELLSDAGAADVDAATGIALTYHNDVDAFDAARGAEDTSRVAVVNLTHAARVRVSGADRGAFLRRETTHGGGVGEVALVSHGEGAGSVCGAALDAGVVVSQGQSELLLLPPESRADAAGALGARVRPDEDVTVADVSGPTAQFALVGEGAADALRSLLGDELVDSPDVAAVLAEGAPAGLSCMAGFQGSPCSLIRAEPLGPSTPQLLVVTDAGVTAEMFAALVQAGCVPMGSNCWEKLRVRCGRPRRGFELGVRGFERTPLEANLWHACSAGGAAAEEGEGEPSAGVAEVRQRAAARSMEYHLWSLELPVYVPPGDAVEVDGVEQGMVTSVVQTPGEGELWALAYVKARAGVSDGGEVRVGTRRAIAHMPEYGSRRLR